MPRTPLEVVQANSAAFSAMDVDAMLALYAPDATVVDRRRVSMGTFSGHDELRAYYLSIFHSAAELTETIAVYGEGGGVVALHCELVGRLPGAVAGSTVSVTYGLAVRVSDGLIAHIDVAEDGAHARELLAL